MATINKRPNGLQWIQFTYQKKRRTFRIGRVSDSMAFGVKEHVESLILCRQTGQPIPRQTVGWLNSIKETWRKRLVAIGLVDAPKETKTVGELVDYVLKEYSNNSPATIQNYKKAKEKLEEHFHRNTPLEIISAGDADEMFRTLRSIKTKLGTYPAESYLGTIHKCCSSMFNIAIRKQWIEANPFKHIGGFDTTNKERQEFIDRATIERLLKALDNDPMWQVIVSLVRYGGLRAPKEVLWLKWQHFNFKKLEFKVHCSKTKRFRTVPLFPELVPYLRKWEPLTDSVHLVPKHRSGEKSLYSAFAKRLKSRGFRQWEKLFINLRSSRETELVEEYPLHVVTAWLGNSPEIAKKHYLQVTKEHFNRAVLPKSDVKSDVK